MRKVWMVCAVLAFAASSTFATNYVWDLSNNPWTTTTSWTPNGVPTTGDSAYIGGGTLTAATGISVGALRSDAISGQPALNIGANTLTVINDNGMSGNLFWRSNSGITAGAINVYGNVMIIPSSSFNWAGVPVLRLMGTNQAFRDTAARAGYNVEVYGTGAWDNGMFQLYDKHTTLTVKSGAKLGDTASTAQGWSTGRLILEDGQANMPSWKAPVNFSYFTDTHDNGIVRNAITGGILYSQDVSVTQGYSGVKGITPLTWRVKGGAFKVGRDFIVNSGLIQSQATLDGVNLVFSSEDNGAIGASVDFEVCRDLKVGVAAGGATSPLSILKLNNSHVKVGRDLLFGLRSDAYYVSNGVANLDNALIRLGRNFQVYDPAPAKAPSYTRVIDAWDPGTSTILCDGNGLGLAQTITTYSYKEGTAGKHIALHNLLVNTTGTVSLANGREGELYLTGDLDIQAGTFNDNNRAITFNGPDHHLKIDPSATITGGSLDNIILLTNAVLRLDSNATMDNIEMQTGSKLYLQGFTLVVEGQTFISGQVDALGVPYTAFGSNGTIYGTFTVPEPTTLLLLGTGALGAFGYIRRRRMA